MGQTLTEKDWVEQHEKGYAKNVFSLTEDEGIQAATLQALQKLNKSDLDVLLPGCGSVGVLEQVIAKNMPQVRKILCTDFKAVVAIPSAQNFTQKVHYQAKNSMNLGLKDAFDAVVVMNSVVSGQDNDNIRMLRSFYKALRPGGRLIGLFPTIFCAFDMLHQLPKTHPLIGPLSQTIDIESSAITDPSHDARQIYYSPLGMHKRLTDVGFQLEKMEVYFMDTPYLKEQSQRLYGLAQEDPAFYELFVTAIKPAP